MEEVPAGGLDHSKNNNTLFASQIAKFKKSLLKEHPDLKDRKKGTQNMQVILKKQ